MCVSPKLDSVFPMSYVVVLFCLCLVFARFVDIGVIVKLFRPGVLGTTFCDKICQ